MAITLEANYSKKIGLPGYSSHQYSLTVRTEVTDVAQVQRESECLHSTLQSAVDHELRNPGWLPDVNDTSQRNGNGHANGSGAWRCSDKQKELILKLADEHRLELSAVEEIAQDRFGKPLRDLNKLNASSLIDELLAQQGNRNGRANGNGQHARSAGGRG